MGFWSDLGNFTCNCVLFAGNVITGTALTVAEYIQKSTGTDTIPDVQRQRIDVKRGLHELNLELLDLRRKYFNDRKKLSNRDKDRFNELLEKRNEKKDELWDVNEAENVEKIRKNPNDVTSTSITPDKPHILQYHIGQISKNKTCPQCGYPMVLNFRRGADILNTQNLFWTCSYNNFISDRRLWHPVQPYQHSDNNIFTNEKIDEFECTNGDLTTIFRADKTDILSRLDQHLYSTSNPQSIKSHICPIHGEELVLRKNRNAANLGALEKYFLGCPHFNFNDPNGPDSCRYKVTLKSPAQLAAILKSYEGKGIL